MATPLEHETAALEAVLLRERVQQLLFTEARLLDERRFGEWLDLYVEDAIYWIPAAADEIDPRREVSIVYDRTAQLRERVWRLESGLAYAQEPHSRTAHVIGNVEVSRVSDDEIEAHTSFSTVEYRRERQYVHAGRALYRLRDDGDGLKIALKKLVLINNDGHIGNLSTLL
jgi:3-phenylpropionate/cinnamic acid dioxygenase small subunit